MSNKSNNSFVSENPFQYLKLRWIFILSFIIFIGLIIQLYIVYELILAKTIDSVFFDIFIGPIIIIVSFIFLISSILKQIKLIDIKTENIIGKIPANYQWLNLIILAVAELFFSYGLYRIFSYLFSLIFPDLVASYMEKTWAEINNLGWNQYFLEYFYEIIMTPALIFVFSIILYRFSYKWGQKRALIIFTITYAIFGLNFLPLALTYLSEFVIFPFLYLTSRTLIIPIFAKIIQLIIHMFWYFLKVKVINNFYVTNLDDLQNQLWLGILYLVLTTPIIITFLGNNWYKLNEPLPYFTNQAESPTNINH